MIRLEWSSRFEKSLKKWIAKHPKSREMIKQKLELFITDPYAPDLKNHKLSGRLKGLRAISAGYDCRIVFSFVEENTALLIAIGTHDEVY
ncbi:MAG: type II toxin-antitoxin system mRNA interferase toxin, RelE/StbE family [Spirochaetaceae bacterium]|nr:type II toxin-antitoxin system mRNA interferase toxin, RelE/StbE family [Spirochaetaceae bacterium]